MQFTEIHELNNLIRETRQQTRYRLSSKQLGEISNSQSNTQATQIIKDILSIRQPSIQIAKQLDLYAMSYFSQMEEVKQADSPLGENLDRTKAKSELLNFDTFQIEPSKLIFARKKISDMHSMRFSTLNGRLSTALQKKNAFVKKTYKIRVFYFGTKTYKSIECDSQTLCQTLIKRAIHQYMCDSSLDQSQIKTPSREGYHLLMCDDGSYLPDMDLEPVNSKKRIKQLNVDAVALVKNSNHVQESHELLGEYATVNIHDRKSIIVVNEVGEEMLKMNMDNDAIAAAIYQKIEKMEARYQQDRFYLSVSEEAKEGGQISKDLRVSDLPTTIYIKMKRYADEAEIVDRHKKSEDIQAGDIEALDIQAPMGIAQASMYEEFPVIKINKRGARQSRILGIDQIKIYNYDRQIRKEDKQVSFFTKMFGNVNVDFGTKTPQRLIADIVSIKEIPQQNLLIIEFSNVFSSKSLEFEIEPKVRRRVIQKLRVLRNHNQNRV